MDKTVRALKDLSAADRQLRDTGAMTEAFVHTLEKRRTALRETIPEAFLAAYDALGRIGRFPVVVEVRSAHCGGCYLRLPPQLDSAIRKRQSLRSCPHCGRLLYLALAEEPRETKPSQHAVEKPGRKDRSPKRVGSIARRPMRREQPAAERQERHPL